MANKEKTKISWITRELASKINCATLHAQTQDRLLNSSVVIRIAAGVMKPDGMGLSGDIILVPNVDKPLSMYCEEPWIDFCLYITYSNTGYKGCYRPTDVSTRAEFIIQTLDIWESMYERLEKLNPTLAAELEIASAHLRSCYMTSELMDIQSTVDEIDAIVVAA